MPTRDSGGDQSRKSYSSSKSADSEDHAVMDLVTRRRLVSLGASASLSTLLAGCSQDRDDVGTTVDTDQDGGDTPMDPEETEPGTTTVTEEPGGDVTMRTFVQWDWPADETQLTDIAASNWAGGYSGAFFHAPCTVWSYDQNQYIPYLLKENPTYRKCYQQHTFRQDFNWWNGKTVTARDHIYGHRIAAWMCCGGPDEVVWAAMEGDSKWMWEESKGAPYTEQQAAANAMKGIRYREDIFKPLLDNFKEADGEEGINAATEEVQDLNLPLSEVEDHQHGNGLWKPVDWAADQITMEQFEDHPDYGRSDIDRWVIQVAPKQQTQLQLINNDQVDAGHTRFRSRLQNPPSALETIRNVPGTSGSGIKFNWRRKHGGNLYFRRALASLLPPNQIAQSANASGVSAEPMPYQVMAGPKGTIENFTEDGFLDQMIDYGGDSRPDEATAWLEAGGYSKQGGNWVGPDGETVEVRLIAENVAINANIGSAVSGILSNFGIQTNFSVLESGSFADEFGTRDNPPADSWDMVIEGPNIGRIARDLMGIDDIDSSVGWQRPPVDDCIGEPTRVPVNVSDPMPMQEGGNGRRTWFFGIPITGDGGFPEVPTQYGQEELSGETMRPRLGHQYVWAQYRFDESTITDWVQDQLWWNNFHMHGISFYVGSNQYWMNTDKFRMKDDGQVYEIRPDYYPHCFGDVESA